MLDQALQGIGETLGKILLIGIAIGLGIALIIFLIGGSIYTAVQNQNASQVEQVEESP